MNLIEFKKDLLNASIAKKREMIKSLNKEDLNLELFEVIFSLLKSKDEDLRFFALFNLIDKFDDRFKLLNENKIDVVVNLLFDSSNIISDRSTWAIALIGNKGIEKLFLKSNSKEDSFRVKIAWAIGKLLWVLFENNQIEKSIEILLSFSFDENEEVRFHTMCTLHDLILINNKQDNMKQFDTSKCKENLINLARGFSDSEKESYSSFANRFLTSFHA